MTQVFCICTYDIFNISGFFSEFKKFVGHFQIQQSIQQSYEGIMELWFFTDKVIIEEDKSRQVEVTATRLEYYEPIFFTISKI